MRITVTLEDQDGTIVETRTGLTAEEAARLAGRFLVFHGADPDGLAADAPDTPWEGNPGTIRFTPEGTPASGDADLSPAAEQFLFPDRRQVRTATTTTTAPRTS